jgi:sec-independent protein translocase protein TatA
VVAYGSKPYLVVGLIDGKVDLMFGRNPQMWLLVILVVVILFGAKRLPDSARSLGRSLRIFKSEVKELNKDEKKSEEGDTSAKS